MQECLIKCGKQGKVIRGLCTNCYRGAIHAIREKTTTWEELERMKMALPPNRKTGPRSPFGLMLEHKLVNKPVQQ